MNQPIKLTIITINYNNKEGLERTMTSVFSQSYQDFEYIIIDGGSIDGSKDLLVKYSNKISYWVSEKDKGIYHAMNKGINKSSGEYLLFLNSGDILYSDDVIDKVILELNSSDVISACMNISEENKEDHIWTSPKKITFELFYHYGISHPCTFIRRKCFDIVGEYDEGLKIVSDWKWFLLALFKYNLSYKSIDLVVSTFYMDGLSSQASNQDIMMEERKTTLRDSFPLFYDDYVRLHDLQSYKDDLHRSRFFKFFWMMYKLFKKG